MQALENIEKSFQDNAHKNSAIMSDLKEKVEWSFVQLGLSDEQEHELAQIISDAEKESTALYESGLKIEDQITELTDVLSKFSQ